MSVRTRLASLQPKRSCGIEPPRSSNGKITGYQRRQAEDQAGADDGLNIRSAETIEQECQHPADYHRDRDSGDHAGQNREYQVAKDDAGDVRRPGAERDSNADL